MTGHGGHKLDGRRPAAFSPKVGGRAANLWTGGNRRRSRPTFFVTPLTRFIRRLTLDQWAAIDAEYRQGAGGLDWRNAFALALAALMLTLEDFFGGSDTFQRIFGPLVSHWVYPKLWGLIYWSFGCAVIYFVIPALYVRFVLRERIGDYGFNIKNAARHLHIYLLMFLCVVPLVVLASHSPSFLHRYPFYKNAGHSWTELIAWEGAYALQFVTLEFFFRGFLLFALARSIGAYAIFVMVMPYNMIHFHKPFPEAVAAILAGIALGTLALRTRSIFGGMGIHIGVAWSMDLLALAHKGQLAALIQR